MKVFKNEYIITCGNRKGRLYRQLMSKTKNFQLTPKAIKTKVWTTEQHNMECKRLWGFVKYQLVAFYESQFQGYINCIA